MPCSDFSAALDFYTNELGFRIDVIFPADAPRVAELSGYGIQCRLEHSNARQEVGNDDWTMGRAGMQYRDLIPDRLGGRMIASHIRISVGGPVPDYVHHHHVKFQIIYCYKGWVKVVYEDQGPPFVMKAGDCVLQPPHIRHRVLECSDNMEVIEVSSPAEHETLVDHDMILPSNSINRDRDFNGQGFVFHELENATWRAAPKGFESRDTGIEQATNGRASVQVIRATNATTDADLGGSDESLFNFVLQGSMTLRRQDESEQILEAGGSFVANSGTHVTLTKASESLELLQVSSSPTLTGSATP